MLYCEEERVRSLARAKLDKVAASNDNLLNDDADHGCYGDDADHGCHGDGDDNRSLPYCTESTFSNESNESGGLVLPSMDHLALPKEVSLPCSPSTPGIKAQFTFPPG
eukprot:sb/3477591/